MNTTTREEKVNALLKLLEFSLLFDPAHKEMISSHMDELTDEEIDGLGKILAVEHRNREEIDQKTLEAFITSLEEKVQD